jgi:hypothetical protein
LKPLCDARHRPLPFISLPTSFMVNVSSFLEFCYYWNIPMVQLFTKAEVLKMGITHYFPPRKAMNELGYQPTITSHQGAYNIAQHYKLNPDKDIYYFKSPNMITWSLVLGGMYTLYLSAFHTATTPTTPVSSTSSPFSIEWFLKYNEQLGLLIFRSKFGLKMAFYAAMSTHMIEGIYAGKVALVDQHLSFTTSFAWFTQTFLLGYHSLSLLLQAPQDTNTSTNKST